MNKFAELFGYFVLAILVGVIATTIGFAIFDVPYEEIPDHVVGIAWASGWIAGGLYTEFTRRED